MHKQEPHIKAKFTLYLQEITLKYCLLLAGVALLVIGGFGLSDIYFRNNLLAASTRLIPLVVMVPLCLLHLLTQTQFKRLKYSLYNMALVLILIMMYAKYLVYLHEGGAGNSTTGIVVVLFLISLELKTNLLYSVLIYLLPTLAFTAFLLFIPEVPKEKVVNIINVYPMVLLGFAINRIQYRLRYRLFLSNYLLQKEKEVTHTYNEELRQMNEEMETQKQDIEEKNILLEELLATKDKIFSVISHDLKSSFNGMLGFTTLLKKESQLQEPEKQQEYIQYIGRSIDSAYKLLENLLVWAQSQRKDHRMRVETQNVYLIVQQVLQMLREQAKAKQIHIVNSLDVTLELPVDRNYLETILRNLITNALKFSPEGTSIHLSSTLEIQGDGRSYQVLCVADSGVGIPAEQIPHLFNLQEHSSSKGTKGEPGSGLGLVLCKEFAEKMQGHIRVESAAGEGSKFFVALPVVNSRFA